MACIQLVTVLLKLIFAHLQNFFEKNSGSLGAFGISQSTLQDTKYLLPESHLHCRGAKGNSQFVSPGWNPFIFSFGWRVALPCIHFFPPPLFLPLNTLGAVSLAHVPSRLLVLGVRMGLTVICVTVTLSNPFQVKSGLFY